MRKFFSSFRKSWDKPVSIMVIPYGPTKPLRMRFTFPFLAFVLVLWSGITIWAAYITTRHVDYYITKADNKVLQTKMALIADEISKGRKYLTAIRQTETQMRQLLGMGSRDSIIKEDAVGGANHAETINFKKILEQKASEISESVFKSNITQVSDSSKRALASFQEIAWYIANKRSGYASTPSIWPAVGRVSSPYGYRFSPFGGTFGEFHSGIDISNKPDTPIYAAADGVVRHAGWALGYGQAVLIDHGFGLSTLYAHTTEIQVKEGQRVKRGEQIAKMGTTGRSTGTHLHYEVWESEKTVNPMKYLNSGASKTGSSKKSS